MSQTSRYGGFTSRTFMQINFVATFIELSRVSGKGGVRSHFYLGKNVHLSVAWSLFCSCIRSCRWCSCRSDRNRRCDVHTRQYLWGTGNILTTLEEDFYTNTQSWMAAPRDSCSSLWWTFFFFFFFWTANLTFACFSIRLQCEANGAAAAHACGCVLTGAVTPPVVHRTGFWNDNTQHEMWPSSLGKQCLVVPQCQMLELR